MKRRNEMCLFDSGLNSERERVFEFDTHEIYDSSFDPGGWKSEKVKQCISFRFISFGE